MYYRHVGNHQRLHVVSLNPKQHPKNQTTKLYWGYTSGEAARPGSPTLRLFSKLAGGLAFRGY